MDTVINLLNNSINQMFVMLNNKYCLDKIDDALSDTPFINPLDDAFATVVEDLNEQHYLYMTLIDKLEKYKQKERIGNMLFDLYSELSTELHNAGINIEKPEKLIESSTHIKQIIDQLSVEDRNKIPKFIISIFTEHAVSDQYNLDFTVPIKTQISEETSNLLVYIYKFIR